MALIVFTRFVERIGIAGVTILISAGLKEDDGREISAIQHRGEIYKIVLMICAIRGGSNHSGSFVCLIPSPQTPSPTRGSRACRPFFGCRTSRILRSWKSR